MTFFTYCLQAETLTLRLVGWILIRFVPLFLVQIVPLLSWEQRKSLKSRKKNCTPRSLREYYATGATGSYVAHAAFSLRAPREKELPWWARKIKTYK
jgi:hypothetical protein